MALLDQIFFPEDLRGLPKDKLPQVAQELRQEILNQVSKTGGHLAASLGTVELTVALHYVFETPKDKLIWDVGHQGYGHKILTGRREQFPSLRQYNGLSGFLKRSESEYDTFGAGHASTAISAALGMKEAFEHRKCPANVVAVVGDGGLTGGVALEGLNHAGDLQRNMIVVLNDNEMSISPNVGALSRFLSKRVTGTVYGKIRREFKELLKYFSGPINLLGTAKKVHQSLKTLLTPGSLFEAFGFRYIGPIDGHDVLTLVETFSGIKGATSDGPLLVHVLTKKGYGYPIAEKAPVAFHGVNTFDLNDGKPLKSPSVFSPPAFTNVFANSLIALAERDPRIVAITAAMPTGTGLVAFQERFPDRFYDVGIAEQHSVLFAAGLACEGMRPVCAIYSTFLQRAFDQLIHDVGIQQLPVVFALDRAGLVGEDGPTHHGAFDLSYLRAIPNFVVMAPKDENELQHMMATALDYENGPIAVRFPRGNGLGVPMDPYPRALEIGKAEVLYPQFLEIPFDEVDIALIAIGSQVHPALQAANHLRSLGHSAIVINARFVKPLDEDLLVQVASQVPVVITIEENSLLGGFGSAVLECFEQKGLFPQKIKRLGIPDTFITHGPLQTLREECGLTAKMILLEAQKLLETTQESLPRITSPHLPLHR